MAENINVMIVDDHPIVRQGVKSLLGIDERYIVCSEASSAPEAIQKVQACNPDVVIVDITLKGSDGLELIKALRGMDLEFPILVMSMHDENLYAERVLKAGGNGYVMKRVLSEVLLDALDRVLDGKIYVSDAVQDQFLKTYSAVNRVKQGGVDSLSDRELEVFRHIGNGRSTRDIAEDLNLSVKTIETYRAHIKEKLGLASAPELACTATRWVEQQYSGL